MKTKKFTVSITRISYSSKDFTVEAKNKKDAESLAIQAAYDHDFGVGQTARYEVDNCIAKE